MQNNPRKKISLSYNSRLKETARKLRTNPTPAEKHFWNILRKMPFYSKLSVNRQKPIGEYIVDFYCRQHQLVIEIDGDTHGSAEAQKNDRERTRFLESLGLQVIRFTNKEILEYTEGVMTVLAERFEKLQKPKSPYPPSWKGGPI